ncbi:MAG: hypothetical protein CO068_12090 [Flavobacteriaceae bacterium CG_4_9_14_0_8_um_filter_34_30]|nr:hypothetical protein [Flavobacteriia bacterium]PIZ07005.1 MAG: hypothetical protein COY56_11215 [Flavobacteriaceae bacterium CG_4_10_14_0_8_um_filter_34_31]PJC06258.1 MAG: hypothetical protein CO068_12090 [Flavobacteriaceae bacterium CG_4_9_14_0_8_um_filter_34_30]
MQCIKSALQGDNFMHCAAIGAATGGAALGGATGFAGGVASGSMSAAFNGGDFGSIVGGGFKGGFIGGASGAAIGGLSGGLNAVSNDREFWSGKKWQYAGTSSNITSNTVIDYANWDVEASIRINGIPQQEQFDCTVGCLQTVDGYYQINRGVTYYDGLRGIAANGQGINTKSLIPLYKSLGYKVDPLGNGFNNHYTPDEVLPFLAKSLNAKHVPHVTFHNSAGPHSVIAHKVKYLSDFSKFQITTFDPGVGTTTFTQRNFTRSNIFSIFSLSR